MIPLQTSLQASLARLLSSLLRTLGNLFFRFFWLLLVLYQEINPISTTAQSFQLWTFAPSGVVVVVSINLRRFAHCVGVNSNLLNIILDSC